MSTCQHVFSQFEIHEALKNQFIEFEIVVFRGFPIYGQLSTNHLIQVIVFLLQTIVSLIKTEIVSS